MDQQKLNSNMSQLQQFSMRFNNGKLRWMLLPIECIEEVILILMKGAIKYADDNWKSSINTEDHDKFIKDRMESIHRHLSQIRKGKSYDDELLINGQHRPNGVPYTIEEIIKYNRIETTHAGAVAINALFIVWYTLHDSRK